MSAIVLVKDANRTSPVCVDMMGTMVRDPASWISFLKMLAGDPPAQMKVHYRNTNKVETLSVVTAERGAELGN